MTPLDFPVQALAACFVFTLAILKRLKIVVGLRLIVDRKDKLPVQVFQDPAEQIISAL